MLHWRYDNLRDAVALGDLEIIVAEIGQDDLHLAAIIAVDGAGRVQAGDTVFQSKPRTRTDLHFIAMRYRKGETGRDREPLADAQVHAFGGTNVHPRRTLAGIIGQRKPRAVGQALDANFDRRCFRRFCHGTCLRQHLQFSPSTCAQLPPSGFRASFRPRPW